MLDLLLIHPGGAKAVYQDLGEDLSAIEPPLWCRLIAGYVRARGFSVRIIDAEAENLAPGAVAILAAAQAPRLVCIVCYGHQPSASTQMMPHAGAIAREIKRLDPGQKAMMVGGHVAALPERTLREEAIDYACNGEGPRTVVELLSTTPPEIVAGLAWRDGDAILMNSPPPLLNVDELHGDAWDLLPMQRYRAHNWQCFGDLQRQPYASIYTSLGCPYKCSFCCINAPFGTNRYRMRKPADVVNEIAHLHEVYGVRTFKIIDELFVLNERHYTAICEGLIELYPDAAERFNFWAYARVDTVKEGHLGLLRKAGVRWLALGIESASAHVRDGAAKAMKNDDITGVVRAIQAAGINVIGNFIFGLPDDDRDSMGATLDLALSLNCEFANFYSAMAYPGSPLYADAVRRGLVLPGAWSGFSQHSRDCRPLDTDHVSAREVLAFRDAAFHAYFSNPAYLAMVSERFGPATRAHVEAMASRRLERDLLA